MGTGPAHGPSWLPTAFTIWLTPLPSVPTAPCHPVSCSPTSQACGTISCQEPGLSPCPGTASSLPPLGLCTLILEGPTLGSIKGRSFAEAPPYQAPLGSQGKSESVQGAGRWGALVTRLPSPLPSARNQGPAAQSLSGGSDSSPFVGPGRAPPRLLPGKNHFRLFLQHPRSHLPWFVPTPPFFHCPVIIWLPVVSRPRNWLRTEPSISRPF